MELGVAKFTENFLLKVIVRQGFHNDPAVFAQSLGVGTGLTDQNEVCWVRQVLISGGVYAWTFVDCVR